MAERDVPPDPRFASATARSWRQMPSVLWPWAYELVVVDTAITAVDLVALEPRRVRGTLVETGTPFSIRLTGQTESTTSDLAVLAAWAATGARVTLLASQHARTSWICLSLGHWRELLTGVESYLGGAERIEGPDAASSRGARARSAHFCTRE
jgi:hypothetical protein